MNYLVLNGLVLLGTILASLILLRRIPAKHKHHILKPFWFTLSAILLLTVLFDSLIIAAGIVGYDTARILGVYIGRAPIEDFAYAVASVVLVVLIWEYCENKR